MNSTVITIEIIKQQRLMKNDDFCRRGTIDVSRADKGIVCERSNIMLQNLQDGFGTSPPTTFSHKTEKGESSQLMIWKK